MRMWCALLVPSWVSLWETGGQTTFTMRICIDSTHYGAGSQQVFRLHGSIAVESCGPLESYIARLFGCACHLSLLLFLWSSGRLWLRLSSRHPYRPCTTFWCVQVLRSKSLMNRKTRSFLQRVPCHPPLNFGTALPQRPSQALRSLPPHWNARCLVGRQNSSAKVRGLALTVDLPRLIVYTGIGFIGAIFSHYLIEYFAVQPIHSVQ